MKVCEKELEAALKRIEELERALTKAEMDRDYWAKAFYNSTSGSKNETS